MNIHISTHCEWRASCFCKIFFFYLFESIFSSCLCSKLAFILWPCSFHLFYFCVSAPFHFVLSNLFTAHNVIKFNESFSEKRFRKLFFFCFHFSLHCYRCFMKIKFQQNTWKKITKRINSYIFRLKINKNNIDYYLKN